MKVYLLAVVVIGSLTLAAAPGQAASYETDSRTTSFLHYHLLSGADFHYPPEAYKAKAQGTGFFVMRLRPDGHVESVTIKMSTGYKSLDDGVIATLKTYQFTANTKGPLLWLAGFLYPDSVLVKIIGLEDPTPAPRKK